MTAVPVDEAVASNTDCAVIVTDHAAFDYEQILHGFPLIVDTRNALKTMKSPRIFRL
jgi:UDP-N-acetyl-D-glucosamine dehydrogenase